MAHPTHHRPALDLEPAAALHVLHVAIGVEQATVTDLHPASRPDRDSAATQTRAWQATLGEEAS
jgi:hypothetical protein